MKTIVCNRCGKTSPDGMIPCWPCYQKTGIAYIDEPEIVIEEKEKIEIQPFLIEEKEKYKKQGELF